jgi:hypothetical protein
LVCFDINNKGKKFYRIDQFIDVLQNVIPEFAFGHHLGKEIQITEITKILRDSAKAIYKIKEFAEAKKFTKGAIVYPIIPYRKSISNEVNLAN